MVSKLEKTMAKSRRASIPSALTTTTMQVSATSLKFTDPVSQEVTRMVSESAQTAELGNASQVREMPRWKRRGIFFEHPQITQITQIKSSS
jgi:hypothetical protein